MSNFVGVLPKPQTAWVAMWPGTRNMLLSALFYTPSLAWDDCAEHLRYVNHEAWAGAPSKPTRAECRAAGYCVVKVTITPVLQP